MPCVVGDGDFNFRWEVRRSDSERGELEGGTSGGELLESFACGFGAGDEVFRESSFGIGMGFDVSKDVCNLLELAVWPSLPAGSIISFPHALSLALSSFASETVGLVNPAHKPPSLTQAATFVSCLIVSNIPVRASMTSSIFAESSFKATFSRCAFRSAILAFLLPFFRLLGG